jgi:hypothetical protein
MHICKFQLLRVHVSPSTLTRMAGEVYDFQNFERTQLKMA